MITEKDILDIWEFCSKFHWSQQTPSARKNMKEYFIKEFKKYIQGKNDGH